MQATETAWAGGLFEGEGCFGLYSSGKRSFDRLNANVTSTDRDVLERFLAAVGFGSITGPWPGTNKPRYRWTAHSFERFQALGAMLWPYLGERRRAKFHDCITTYVASPRRGRGR